MTLSQTRLPVPHESIVATTYQAELARIYGVADPHALLLSTSFSFRLCPACVAEDRLLTRTLVLPHITICPRHQIVLVNLCLCGTALRPFHWRALPFRCFKCGLDWAELPRNKADHTRIEIEEQLLSYYQFFWTYGTPEVLASTQRLVYDSVVEKGAIRAPLSDNVSQSESLGRSYRRTSSLGYLVHLLWQLDLTPGDILVYAGPLPWRSAKWTRFQCEVPHCPYAMMRKSASERLGGETQREVATPQTGSNLQKMAHPWAKKWTNLGQNYHQRLAGRFLCFALISYISPQKSSNIHAIYYQARSKQKRWWRKRR